ncbi:MAG: PRC-barrel domain-containing protein [Anaerolineae bacterium]|nr:PRC-barrel domain-containing protein [Anaerolineae bacterium]
MIKTLDLIGMPIITMNLGENIGKVKDVLIDPTKLELAALVLPSKAFSKDTMVVPCTVIHVFGRDVILVKSNEAMVRDNTLHGVASLLSTSKLKGRPIATEKGVKVGILNDIIIDGVGQIVGYDLARVFVKGPVAQSKRVPTRITRSIGPDMIIVDSQQIDSV